MGDVHDSSESSESESVPITQVSAEAVITLISAEIKRISIEAYASRLVRFGNERTERVLGNK